MSRGGRQKTREVSERRCAVTGEVAPKHGLLRFVVGPGDTIVPDPAEKLPGRGVWVTADRPTLERAVARNAFARAARQRVDIPPDLLDRVETGLADRVTSGLSLARKAGSAVAGLEKVKTWLEGDRAAVLVQATDGSPREKAALRPPEGSGTHVACLSATEIGLAFGRDRVIHAALAAGGLADRVSRDAARLSGVRMIDGARTSEKGVKAR